MNTKKNGRTRKFSPTVTALSFELCGEEFEAVPDLDYRLHNDTVSRLKSDSNEDSTGIDFLIDMIRAFLIDDETRDRFDELLNSEATVPTRLINDVWTYLLIEYKILEAPKN
jgi:hypothetical protein